MKSGKGSGYNKIALYTESKYFNKFGCSNLEMRQ